MPVIIALYNNGSRVLGLRYYYSIGPRLRKRDRCRFRPGFFVWEVVLIAANFLFPLFLGKAYRWAFYYSLMRVDFLWVSLLRKWRPNTRPVRYNQASTKSAQQYEYLYAGVSYVSDLFMWR